MNGNMHLVGVGRSIGRQDWMQKRHKKQPAGYSLYLFSLGDDAVLYTGCCVAPNYCFSCVIERLLALNLVSVVNIDGLIDINIFQTFLPTHALLFRHLIF